MLHSDLVILYSYNSETNKVIFILFSFIHSDMNFQTILMPKVIYAKNLSEKSWSLGFILIFLKKALRHLNKVLFHTVFCFPAEGTKVLIKDVKKMHQMKSPGNGHMF